MLEDLALPVLKSGLLRRITDERKAEPNTRGTPGVYRNITKDRPHATSTRCQQYNTLSTVTSSRTIVGGAKLYPVHDAKNARRTIDDMLQPTVT